jgi:hypothetical protein
MVATMRAGYQRRGEMPRDTAMVSSPVPVWPTRSAAQTTDLVAGKPNEPISTLIFWTGQEHELSPSRDANADSCVQ